MNPPAAGYSATYPEEKGPEMRGLLTPPPVGPPGYAAVYQPSSTYVNPQERPRNARRRRFWHFLACTVLFFVALHLLLHQRPFKKGLGPLPWSEISPGTTEPEAQWSPSICEDNVNWKDDSDRAPTHGYHYRAHTTLTLPVSAEELSFIAEGANAYGTFDVSQDAHTDSENAVVDIEVEYRVSDALDDATVCRTHAGQGKWGLGIFTPRWSHPHNERQLRFFVHVHLPSSDKLNIKRFFTDLPIFRHHLAELADTVHFEEVSLRSSNSPIDVDSLAADRVRATTSNTAIRGKFNTSTTLELQTLNAPIVAEATLVNGRGEQPTRLILKTSNAHIDSSVHLQSSTSSATGGKYDVSARTSNGPIDVSIIDAPVGHTLTLDAHTSNVGAHVALPKTFEGSFDLQSSRWFRPTVEWDQDVEDPAGKRRTRHVELHTINGGSVRGNAWWEEGRKNEGTVTVATSNAAVRLEL
ncbi:hypothetical protein BD309DRAFT_1078468 [Dichomitus squalens]|uniref:DUF7330 domain-containing protein n=1 Tax=Dichomitus squalens TaxID=114155 RepID=A0A4Q9P3R1_9APHY|nr:hypothetical protein BD309DRAFT_1078468 [Dichomitus squalens]TBU56339.1 hypothetical protein BD310DRAFT_630868 [Dichomitus squalens]